MLMTAASSFWPGPSADQAASVVSRSRTLDRTLQAFRLATHLVVMSKRLHTPLSVR